MKKTLLLLTFFALSFFGKSQDNPTNAATLLNVPQEFVKYNGQVQKKIQYEIVETRLIDYTNVDTVNGKLKQVVQTTSTFSAVPVVQDFGAYALNIMSNYIYGYGVQVTSDSTFYKPSQVKTVTVGPFAGYTYLFGYDSVTITKGDGVYNYEVVNYPYMNTERDGKPAITPWLSVRQINKVRTGSISMQQRTLTYKVSNVRETTSRGVTVRYTKEQINQLSGWDDDKIADAKKTIFQIYQTSGNTHGNSIATSIQKSGNTYTGSAYINGINLNQLNYKNLMAPFFQKYGGYVNRWRLNNGASNSVAFGSTWMKQLESNESTDLIIIAGSSFNYNESTNTLTYDANKPAELWFQTEFLPAQGKQTVWETRMNLATGEVIWK